MSIALLKDIAQNCPKSATLLGLDVGKKTIGLALGNVTLGIATPLETIKRTKFTRDMEALYKIAREHDVDGYIIGLPVNMDGSEGPRAQSTRDFAIEMKRTLLSFRTAQSEESRNTPSPSSRDLSPPSSRDLIAGSKTTKETVVKSRHDEEAIFIALWDERLSTVSVEGFVDNLVEKRKTKIEAKSSGLIDKLAAQTILQGALDYLSAHP